MSLRIEHIRYAPTPGVIGERADITIINTESGETIYEAKLAELPYMGNKPNISAIAEGEYKLIPRQKGGFYRLYKKKFGFMHGFEIKGVPGRSDVLIHGGNYPFPRPPVETGGDPLPAQSRGCPLIGEKHGVAKDADGNDCHCVWSSLKAYQRLYHSTKLWFHSNKFAEYDYIVRNAYEEGDEDLSRDRSDI